MVFRLTDISLILFITTLVNLFTAYTSWQRRKARGGIYFALAMLALSFWTLAVGLDYAAVPIPLKIFFAKLESLGDLSALALLTVFSITYAGHADWLRKPWVKFLLILIPVSDLLLVWTNELHGLVWTGFKPGETGDNILIFEHGLAFDWIAFTGYALLFVMAVNLAQAFLSGAEPSRKQARLLFSALLVTLASNLLYVFDVFKAPGVDWSSITFSITGFLFLIALYGLRLMDIVPIARNTLIERMADSILVLDARGRLMDFNPAARAVFEIQPGDLWSPVQTALARWPEIILLLSKPAGEETQELITGCEARVFDVRLTPLEDSHGQMYGQVVVMRDITGRKQVEEALRASEEHFRQLIMAAPSVVLGIDSSGKISFANQLTINMLGYSPEELIGQEIDLLLPMSLRERHAAQRAEYLAHPRTRPIGSGLELVARHKNGQEVPVDITLSHIQTRNGALVVAFMNDLTASKLTDQHLQQAQENLNAQQRELAVVEERQRMARNLHDSVSQSIHSLVLFSETLIVTIEKKQLEHTRKIAGQLRESARQSLKEMRLLLYELQDQTESIDLLQKLEERLATVERRAGMESQLIYEGPMENCPPEWRENLYWMAMEALNNVLKHAQTYSVQVILRCTPERVELEVNDSGKGFDPGRISAGGQGLKNLRKRAELIGGTLSITSQPGQGTCVRFTGEIKDKSREFKKPANDREVS